MTISCPRCGAKDVKYSHDEHYVATGDWIVVNCTVCGSFPHQVR